jgi:hypothetical protein
MKSKKLLMFLLGTFFGLHNAIAQSSTPTDFFQSKNSGTWNQVSTWESSADNSTWIPSTLVPTSTASAITIRATHTVVIDADVSAKLLTIDIGGVLTYSGPGIGLSLVSDGVTVDAFVINGRYELYGQSPTFGAKAHASVSNSGEVWVNGNTGGGSDNFARDSRVHFNSGLFDWRIPLVFETSGVTYFPNADTSDKAVFRISANVGLVGAIAPTVINGKFEVVSGNSISFQNAGTKTFRDGLGGAGTINHQNDCGPFLLTSATAVIDGSLTINLAHSSGNAMEIASGASVSITGSPSLHVGTTGFPNATLLVTGALIQNGATAIDIALGSLRVDGIYGGSGTITGSKTASITVGVNGVAGLSFTNDGTSNYLKNLTVKNFGQATLGSALYITSGTAFGTVEVENGGTLNARGLLTLKSDALGTARVLGVVSDSVTVERRITAKRAWRILTVPMKTNQTLFSAWQEGYTNSNPVLTCPPENIGTPGFGTNLTYKGINGYDIGVTQNPSIRGFVNNAYYNPVSTTATSMNAFDALIVFVRGDRSICIKNAVAAGSNETTLRAKGILNAGTISKKPIVATAGHYIMVGNPYASSIDLTNVLTRSTGIDPTKFWIFDPGIGLNGGYVTYSGGIITPISTNYPTPASALVIQSGQGFFLQTTATNPEVIFMESDKTPNQSSVFSRKSHPEIQMSLFSDTTDLLDGVAAEFSADSLAQGAIKFSSLFEQLSLKRSATTFGIESRMLSNTKKDTLFLEMTKMKSQEYTLSISMNELFGKTLQVILIDTFLHTEHVITDTLYQYHFKAIDSDTNTYKHRFMMVVDAIKAQALPSSTFSVYPNPVQTNLYIGGAPIFEMVKICDVAGRIVWSGKITSNTINCSSLKKGLYFLTVGNTTTSFTKQ